MKDTVKVIFKELLSTFPELDGCSDSILEAFNILKDCYSNNKMVLVCGNGGSASDSEHIVGELMKGFNLKRPIKQQDISAILDAFPEDHSIASELQGALPAVSLVSQTALSTAYINDVSADMMYAQQVFGYKNLTGIVIGISTSGNAKNVVNAMKTAKAFGIKTIGLTGEAGGCLKDICDVTIRVPSVKVYRIQEYHLPVYHALCAMLEEEFFG